MQKKYKVQYEYINERTKTGIKKYVILDPAKEYSIISFKRLEKDRIDKNKLSFKLVDLTEDMQSENIKAKLELNLLIGKEKFEKKILVYVSEKSNEEFYLGNDFLSSYSIRKKNDNTTKYNLRQEVEIEKDNPDIVNEDDDVSGEYKVQYEYINENFKKYVILNPLEKYSMISLKRLEKDGIDKNKLSFKLIDLTDDMKSENIKAKVELNLLIGKEEIEKKILVYVSEELNERFYLGNDILSFYSIKEKVKDNTIKCNLRQEIEIEEILEDSSMLSRLLYFIVPLIILFIAIIFYYQIYQSKSSSTNLSTTGLSTTDLSPERSFEFQFNEFIKKSEELEQEINSFKIIPITRDIIVECLTLANKIDNSPAFILTGPELVTNLREFGKSLEDLRLSFREMYIKGKWFTWNFGKSIENILQYILIKSNNNNDENGFQKYIRDSVRALKNFYSSIETAHDFALIAEIRRDNTQYQIVKAKEEAEKFIHDSNNPSTIEFIWNHFYSIYDNKKLNDLQVDIKIATKNGFSLIALDHNLVKIAKNLLEFKEYLKEHINYLDLISAHIESQKEFKWKDNEINKAKELLDKIKKNNFNK